MTKVDQDARNELIKAKFANPVLAKKLEAIDRKNTARMKEIVSKYGWPGKSLVGDDGAQAAWLLVQHADLDPDFQKKCLALMKEAFKKGEVSGQNLAYLTDRVLVAEKKKQLYGTQFKTENGELVPSPIEDEANVDKRRKEAGLSTLAEYRKILQDTYQPKAKDRK